MPTLRFAVVAAIALSLFVNLAPVARADEPDPAKDPDLKKLELQFYRDDKLPGKPVVFITSPKVPLTDDDLKLLAQFPELRTLDFSGQNKMTGTGFKHLAGLKKLEKIDLGFSSITDDGVKELAKLKQLKHLNLINTEFTDAGVKALTALTDLETINLGQNFKATDAAFKELGTLKKLQRVYLNNSNAGDDTVKALAALPDLRSLSLLGSNVTDAGFAHLAKAPKLEQVTGSYTMTDKGLKALGEIATLREIDLFNAKVTPEGIIGMTNAQKLTKMRLGFEDKDKEAIKKVKDALPKCMFTPFHVL